MKFRTMALLTTLCCTGISFTALAQTPTLSSLVASQQGGSAFSKLIAHQHLPDWIIKGGVESPMQQVTLKGVTYQVYSACKPHDCASENFALIYSPADNTMSGLFARNNEARHREELQWLNISDALSIDGKTVLYAALSGSLANHPQAFNYTDK
ncbi:Ivy family c-type lysozyme inhibitor [Tatumella sp. JGM118]|uniref:Ivy family c-type lysozyme inhibitor n=1 Tax=Tatumella terrea TaxID=419007 RepID=A0ABW1VZ36_9GAMM|nr:Ivy family c-type lysozyme inhibitor [Tatumella sp. JGM118]MBS0908973.1 C-lysozyme inhibitor [Tatumella sp. JGM118]